MLIKGLKPSPKVGVLLAVLCLAVGVCVSCRTIPPSPPIDFASPGWRIQQGQAVWKPASGKSELVGELLLATRTNGDLCVQFTKTPFVLVNATFADGRWRMDYLAGNYLWRGIGTPPARFSWFELPRVLAGDEPHRGWRFTRTNNLWRLERRLTGERLEGRFFQ
jgi:hypothetical protein